MRSCVSSLGALTQRVRTRRMIIKKGLSNTSGISLLNYSSWCWFDEDPHPVDIRYTHSNLIMCPSNHCKIQEIFKFQWIAGAFIFYLVLNIRWWLWVTVPKWNWTFVLLSYHKCIMRNKKITQPFHELLHESEMEGIHSTQVIIDALRLPLIDISFKTNTNITTRQNYFQTVYAPYSQ